jgi:hypothetical protein
VISRRRRAWWTQPSRNNAADAGPEGEPNHRRGAAPCTKAELREPESPSVVDQEHGDADGIRDGAGHGMPGPRPRDVDEEAGRAGRRVVETRHADPNAGDGAPVRDGIRGHLGQLRNDRRGNGVGVGDDPGRHLAVGKGAPGAVLVLDDGPLEVRGAEVEAEVAGCRSRGHRRHLSGASPQDSEVMRV